MFLGGGRVYWVSARGIISNHQKFIMNDVIITLFLVYLNNVSLSQELIKNKKTNLGAKKPKHTNQMLLCRTFWKWNYHNSLLWLRIFQWSPAQHPFWISHLRTSRKLCTYYQKEHFETELIILWSFKKSTLSSDSPLNPMTRMGSHELLMFGLT